MVDKIKIKRETPEDKAFWDSFPLGDPDKVNPPHIGDSWWEAEKELSIELLSIRKK